MFEKLIKNLKVLKGGAKKRKRKILKRKKRGGDGESHDISIDGKEYLCTPKTEDVETNTEEVDVKEKHEVVDDDDILDDDITSSPDDVQDGGGKRKKRRYKKKGGSSCSGGTEPHLHPVMSGGKKKKIVKMKVPLKPSIKTKKKLYREYLDKKYTKEQLLKKCRKVGIKITKKADGTVKPIKKKTIIEKIIAIKFK